MNYPSVTLPYQQVANGSQPIVCRYIWVYMTSGDLWLITLQLTVSGNTLEEHSQTHEGGECLCCLAIHGTLHECIRLMV